MKYLRNPVTSEVTYATPLAAKKLARYGWTYTDKKAWVDYKRAQVQAAMVKSMPSVRQRLGHLH